MLIYDFIFIGYIIISIELLNFVTVSTLSVEKIINGRKGDQENFKYQAEVLIRKNASKNDYTLCGGGIIADNFVVSAAHCFLDIVNGKMEVSILVVAGLSNLTKADGAKAFVDILYWAKYDYHFSENDIALLKLKHGLGVGQNPLLDILSLPKAKQSFSGQIAVISGYGHYKTEIRYNTEYGNLEAVNGVTDFVLRYAMAKISTDEICKENYLLIDNKRQMCGIMIPFQYGELAGICSGDSGNPLVINGVLLGIASRNQNDCDDTIKGAVYTKVSTYVHFIKRILKGIPYKYTNIYYNRPYMQ